jgi:FAD:protein FMN transferase
MTLVKLARHAMATRFEIVLSGADPIALRAAGEEALDEIDRLENQLSLFRPSSEIARLNARAAFEPIRVTPAVLALLQHARRLNQETDGAFDITVAPLMRCWGFLGGPGHLPKPEELEAARARVGMRLVQFDPNESRVRYEREGVMLDLGAIGKGYAIDRAVEILREAGITSALLHGGTSTVYGLGSPPEGDSWKIEIPGPGTAVTFSSTGSSWGAPSQANSEPGLVASTPSGAPFATVSLRDQSLSVSAFWGKFFRAQDRNFGHIIDPRTGEPSAQAVLSAVVLPSATETDALSTALLTLGPAGHDRITQLRPGIQTLVAAQNGEGFLVKSHGITFTPPA